MNESQLGKELLSLAGIEDPADTLCASMGAIAIKLCTPFVLERMREPTREMRLAGAGVCNSDPGAAWEAMISKALETEREKSRG